MPAVAEILNWHRLAARDLTGIAVALGPGGFSALRVGISVAKGLALASGKPLVGLRTLDLEAHPYLASGVPVWAEIPFDPRFGAGCGSVVAPPRLIATDRFR